LGHSLRTARGRKPLPKQNRSPVRPYIIGLLRINKANPVILLKDYDRVGRLFFYIKRDLFVEFPSEATGLVHRGFAHINFKLYGIYDARSPNSIPYSKHSIEYRTFPREFTQVGFAGAKQEGYAPTVLEYT